MWYDDDGGGGGGGAGGVWHLFVYMLGSDLNPQDALPSVSTQRLSSLHPSNTNPSSPPLLLLLLFIQPSISLITCLLFYSSLLRIS